MRSGYLRTAAFIAVFLLLMTQAAFADEEDVTPDNGIPVVTIEIDENAEGYATIEEMNSSPKHKDECFGTMKIDVPEGFRYSDFPDADCESLPECEMEIRGRGNTSWGAKKKPYKIKLAKKKISVAKNGRIVLKKGLKKGTYKIRVKVMAAGDRYRDRYCDDQGKIEHMRWRGPVKGPLFLGIQS